MKNKIITLIIGILIGAVVTAGCFLIFAKNSHNPKMGANRQRIGNYMQGDRTPTGGKHKGNTTDSAEENASNTTTSTATNAQNE